MATNTIRPSKQPNLPIGPVEYDQRWQDTYSNALRLYFNQVDSFTQGLSGTSGGSLLENPYLCASDSTNQYALPANTPTKVIWDTTEVNNGFTRDSLTNDAIPTFSGVYRAEYSLQFANTANVQIDVYVWLETDGSQVPRSSSKFTVPARKSAGVHGYLVAYSLVEFSVTGGTPIKLYWATDTPYNSVGPVDGVFMEAIAAQTVPYARPANPSAVGSINFLSRLPP